MIPAAITEKPKLNWLGNVFLADTGYINYQWIADGKTVSAGTSNAYKPIIKGVYRVGVMNRFGCTDTSATFNLLVTGLNTVNTSTESNFHFYPNPVKNTLTIEKQGFWTTQAKYEIYNSNGRLIRNGLLIGKTSLVDMSVLSKGYYFLKIIDTKNSMVFNFIKE